MFTFSYITHRHKHTHVHIILEDTSLKRIEKASECECVVYSLVFNVSGNYLLGCHWPGSMPLDAEQSEGHLQILQLRKLEGSPKTNLNHPFCFHNFMVCLEFFRTMPPDQPWNMTLAW